MTVRTSSYFGETLIISARRECTGRVRRSSSEEENPKGKAATFRTTQLAAEDKVFFEVQANVNVRITLLSAFGKIYRQLRVETKSIFEEAFDFQLFRDRNFEVLFLSRILGKDIHCELLVLVY